MTLQRGGYHVGGHRGWQARRVAPLMTAFVSVLFVDDDPIFAYAAARSLEHTGFKTTVALGAMEALEACGKHMFDVVVTDIKLLAGEPHGLALARMIKYQSPMVPVILVTAYPELLEGEVQLPGPVLQKPVDLAHLEREIRALVKL